jgi:hypothetical protein
LKLNAAMCHFKLHDFSSAVADCSSALDCDSSYAKVGVTVGLVPARIGLCTAGELRPSYT